MNNKTLYKLRPVRFLQTAEVNGWQVKIYSISIKAERIQLPVAEIAKTQLPHWLAKANRHFPNKHQVATLILHEGKEGFFAIISRWVDENMLQLYVYLADNNTPTSFKLFSDNGIVTCVWELAVLWFERNAWVDCVLKNPGDPDAIKKYLARQMNEDV